MPNTVTEIEQRRAGGWTLSFFRMNDRDGQELGVLVEIAKDGRTRSRMSSSVVRDDVNTIEVLNAKANAWIAEYEGRDHSGNTGFGDLR